MSILDQQPPKPPLGTSGLTGEAARQLKKLSEKARDVVMTDDLFYLLCERIAQGEPMVSVCADQTMPSYRQVFKYMHKDEKARELYYAAQECRMETMADEILTISYDDSQDFSIDEKSGRRISHNDVVQRARLKTDNLKWTMAKMAPKRFGEKNQTEVTGSGGAPLAMTIITGVPRSENSLIRHKLPAPKIIEGEKAE